MPENTLSAARTDPGKLNLIGLAGRDLEEFFGGLDERPYRARQLLGWLYQRGVLDFGQMTDISLRLRKRLELIASLALPDVVREERSADGTRKWLLDIGCRNGIHSGAGSVDVMHFLAGRLCDGLLVLRDRQAGLQPESNGCRNSRPGVDCPARA